jgi:hypothetical protein
MIYLSGPMAGKLNRNRPEFHRIARLLRERGENVLSPAELQSHDNWEWIDYLRRDLVTMLLHCDSIALMPGWLESNGSYLEHSVAKKLGFQIYWVDALGVLHNGRDL